MANIIIMGAGIGGMRKRKTGKPKPVYEKHVLNPLSFVRLK